MARESTSSSETIKPIYAIYGPELFLKRQAMASLTDRLLGQSDRALALSEHDGDDVALTLADVLDDVRTLPFLTERRLVIVNEADNFISQYRSDLEDYAEEPCATGVLILECTKMPANTRLYKRINTVGEVIECKAIPASKVTAWVVNRCRDAYGKQLDFRTAALLCDQIGDDLGMLDGELEKLAVYVGERRQITAADIEILCGRCREEQVWDILWAIASGNKTKAITLWEQVLQTDLAAEYRAVGGLAYSVRRLLNAKRAMEAGIPFPELKKILMCWQDDVARAQLSAYTTEDLEWMLCKLCEADAAVKNGSGSVQSSIEALIIEMCLRRSAGRRATG